MMVLEGKEICEVSVNGRQLDHVSEFKNLGFVGTLWIRSGDLRRIGVQCASVLHEGIFI